MDNNRKTLAAMKDAAKGGQDRELTVSGVRIRVHPVSASLIQEVVSAIKDPKPPLVPNPDKDNRLEPNDNDPEYLTALDDARSERAGVTSDVMVMFGIELLDGIPEDEEWMKKLKFLERRGALHLDEYDMEDKFELEFLYKKFVLASNEVVMAVSRASGVTEEDVEKAEASFPGN